jgi:ubiquinone/menaquinone biosynthesis C-methylase UbiE
MGKKAKGLSLNYASDYYDFLTPAERSRFRRKQIDLVNLKEGENVLDVGCGTGVLSILAKITVGETGEVQGVDLAPRMISKAHTKSEKANLKIHFITASIDELPYSDEFFDVVISSLMFHHLPIEIKRKGLAEVYRVLKNGGRFFISDFCAPHYLTLPLMYLMFIWIPSTRYQLFGKLPGLIEDSPFGSENIKRIKKGFFLEYYLITKGEGGGIQRDAFSLTR